MRIDKEESKRTGITVMRASKKEDAHRKKLKKTSVEYAGSNISGPERKDDFFREEI